MSGNVVGGVDKNEAREVTHGVHQVCLPSVIGNVTWCPEVDVDDVEGATEWPGKNKFAVTSDGTIGSDAVRALEYPTGDVFATMRPEKTEADAVECFINSHMASRGGGMVGREDVATEGEGYNN